MTIGFSYIYIVIVETCKFYRSYVVCVLAILLFFQDDFLLRHYDKGPCKNKLGHSRASVIWHRTQVQPQLEYLKANLIIQPLYKGHLWSEAKMATKEGWPL